MMTIALYDALLEAGVSREAATRAVENLAYADQVVTKADIADLKADLAELESRLVRGGVALAGIIIAAVTLLVKL